MHLMGVELAELPSSDLGRHTQTMCVINIVSVRHHNRKSTRDCDGRSLPVCLKGLKGCRAQKRRFARLSGSQNGEEGRKMSQTDLMQRRIDEAAKQVRWCDAVEVR